MTADQQYGPRQVVAHNDAADSGNPIHDDETARRFNFTGALVPGVTVFGYLSSAVLHEFGSAWLDEGAAHVRLRQPVYAGDTVTISTQTGLTPAGLRIITADALNADGARCAIMSGTVGAVDDVAPDVPRGRLPPRRELPANRRPATRAGFAAEREFGSFRSAFDAATADDFLAALQEPGTVYRSGVTHPAWLLRQANLIVDRNFALGPWIHVASSIHNHARVHNGEIIEVRAKVQDLFERKGHEYADLDVVLMIDGDPARIAMRVLHRVIYRLAAH